LFQTGHTRIANASSKEIVVCLLTVVGWKAFLFGVNEPIIRIENLYHTFAGARPVEALRGIDLAIREGEYVALVGANGSGKSTLARHLNALLQPTHGDVWIAGINTRDAACLRDIRGAVQMVFQQPDAQLVATVVEEDVAFGPENFGVPASELPERVRTSLEIVGMWAHRQRPPHLLSAGQKQRVAIAGALALRPRVLVLDEATAMLDPAGRAAVLDVVHQLHAQGTTIVTITHDMDEAAQADRVVVLAEGRMALDGSPREVFARAEPLRAMGLDVPPVADLALRLGLPVCLTADELVDALSRTHPSKNGHSGPSENLASFHRTDIQRDAKPIIQVEGLAHSYLRGSPLESSALLGVDLQINRGEIAGLIGPTGSGKSTLLQHLNGLLRPQAGHVVVDGHNLSDPTTDLRAIRRTVGLMFQLPEEQLFERYVGDDVAFGPRQAGLAREEIRERVRWAMESVGLGFEAFKDRLTATLSGGERRRAALAGVLALRPQVLIADEPTAGLDPRARIEVQNIFQRLHDDGVTIMIASHHMDVVSTLCDRVTALASGRVIAAGTTREIFMQPDLLEAHGLSVPPLAAVAHKLRLAGWPVPAGTFNAAEIVGALSSREFPPVPEPSEELVGTRRNSYGRV
jgi:energy-coupling factor transporter ATPase